MSKTLSTRELSDAICVIVGTRPGIVKQSPLIRALERHCTPFFVIHTGQHYSPEMDRAFFEDLELPQPQHRIDNTHRSLHGAQTAEMLIGVEAALLRERPRLVLVGGDANTNLAAALAARKLHIAVAHVEAGLRSFDWRMPEEHNRVMIDHISELLFAPTPSARRHLEAERVRGQIHVVGNTVVDALYQHRAVAERRSNVLERFHLQSREYAVLTLHREENVDDASTLASILTGVDVFSRSTAVPVLFPVHPRTWRRVTEFSLLSWLRSSSIHLTEPLGYLDFLRLVSSSTLLMTDSGGAQQEACILHVPCVTLRETTEWVETLELGANRLAGTQADSVHRAAELMLDVDRTWKNPFGDGRTGERIVALCAQDVLMPEIQEVVLSP